MIAILMSGGLDSYIAYHYAKKMHPERPVVAMIADIGHDYHGKEMEALESVLPPDVPLVKFKTDLVQDWMPDKPTPTNQVIWGRNLLFVYLGAFAAVQHAKGSGYDPHLPMDIWMCALKGEMHRFMPDKNAAFFDKSTDLFSHLYAGGLANAGKLTVGTPFANMSKLDIVRWYLDNGGPLAPLLKTSTCYHPTMQRCGECSACFKRWVAMYGNDITEDYAVDPPTSSAAKKILKQYQRALDTRDTRHYMLARIHETFAVVQKWNANADADAEVTWKWRDDQ